MTRHTSAPTSRRSIDSAQIALPGGWGWGSLFTGRAAVRLPLFVLDLVDALTARGGGRIEGTGRVLAPVMAAGGAGAVEADPGAPSGEDAHAATVAIPPVAGRDVATAGPRLQRAAE